MPDEPVPEADVQEQHVPPDPDPHRRAEEHLAHEEPEADVLEQDLPVDEPTEIDLARDDDRVEPLDAEELGRDEYDAGRDQYEEP